MTNLVGLLYSARWGPRRTVALALCAAVSSGGCVASSSVEPAVVLDREGAPCFAVPGAIGSGPLKLRTLLVSETKSADWKILPKELWLIRATPAGASVGWSPLTCIHYGRVPVGMEARIDAQPLDEHRVYSVFIDARGEQSPSGMRGYEVQFCVVRAGSRTVAREVPWDSAAGRWRLEVCDKVAPHVR
jgi:hypothetical protein